MPGDASHGSCSRRACSRRTRVSPSAIACTGATSARRCARRTSWPTGAADDADDHDVPAPGVDVLDLLAASDETLLARHGRWYIPDREVRYLRRNALIILGNVGDGREPDVEAALRTYLADPDDLLRAHAAWACIQLDRVDLLALVADDPSPLVHAEL